MFKYTKNCTENFRERKREAKKKKGGYIWFIYGSHLEKLNRRKVVEHAIQIHAYIYIYKQT